MSSLTMIMITYLMGKSVVWMPTITVYYITLIPLLHLIYRYQFPLSHMEQS